MANGPQRGKIDNERLKVHLDGDKSMDQEELVSLLAQLDPSWNAKKVKTMMNRFTKDRNGRFNFEEFLEWCCSGSLRISDKPRLKRGDMVRVVKERRTIQNGDEAKVVKVVGPLGTVIDPGAQEREKNHVRVELEERNTEDGNKLGPLIESFSPSELELVPNKQLADLRRAELEQELAGKRHLEQQLKAANDEMSLLKATLEDETRQRKEAQDRSRTAEEALEDLRRTLEEETKGRQEAEDRARSAEEGLEDLRRMLEEETKRRQEAEDRARTAEEGLEDLKRQLSGTKEEVEAMRMRRAAEEEEAKQKRAAEEEARLKAAEDEARLKAEEDEAKRLDDEAEAERLANEPEPPGASRTRLKVRVIRAQGLVGSRMSSSDPYCVVHVVGHHEDATHPPFKTDIQKKTLTPVWDQEHTFDACTLSDELLFEVFDHNDILTDSTLGSAVLSPFDFRPDGFNTFLRLGEKGGSMFKRKKKQVTSVSESGEVIEGPVVFIKVEVLPMMRIPDMPRCFIKLQSAANLRAADRGGKSDPYCICEVPGKPMSRFKTTIKRKTLNPQWSEESEIQEYARGDNLQITVFDHDRCSSVGDPLGSVLLTTDRFDPNGFNDSVTLEGKGALENSTLTLLVDVF